MASGLSDFVHFPALPQEIHESTNDKCTVQCRTLPGSSDYLQYLERKNPTPLARANCQLANKSNCTLAKPSDIATGVRKAVLIGDSHVRSVHLEGLDTITWTWPGLRAGQLPQRLPEALKGAGDSPTVLLCVGSNDVGVASASEIKDSVSRALDVILLEKKNASIIVIGLFPRRKQTDWKQATLINGELANLCLERKQRFVLVWDQLLNTPGCMASDGVHLTRKGKDIFQCELAYALAHPKYMGNWAS
jgi:hypothetical protein